MGFSMGGAIGVLDPLGLASPLTGNKGLFSSAADSYGARSDLQSTMDATKDQASWMNDLVKQYNKQASYGFGQSQQSLGLLKSAAEGNAPSKAQGVLQQGLDQSIASQMAMANSGNLGQMISGQKRAMDNAAMLTNQVGNQASMLRAQEMAEARGQYAQASQSLYGSANQAGLGYAGQATTLTTEPLNAQMSLYSTDLQNSSNQSMGIMGMASGVLAGFAKSDRRVKKNIKKPKENELDEILETLTAYKFHYKKPNGANGATPGQHLGVMAQDVEKSKLGKSVVKDTAEGKGLDVGSALGLVLALSTRLHDRIKDLEGRSKSMKKKRRK